jgi:hypothetical protein
MDVMENMTVPTVAALNGGVLEIAIRPAGEA